MSYNISADLWYQYFMADGPQIWILIVVFGARSVWALIGIVFNVGLIWTTVKCKSLHGICNILLALESCLSTSLNATYLISLLILISSHRFVRYAVCFPILVVPGNVLGNCAQLTMVFTGADRLCAVVCPIWHKNRKKTRYLAFIGIMLLCYAVYQFTIYHMAYQENLDMMVSCSTTEMGAGKMAVLMSTNGYTLSAILMAEYTFIWLFTFKISALSESLDLANRRLARSLLFIIGFNLLGVFVKCSVLFVLQFVPVSVFFQKGQSVAFSFLTIAVYSANAPVLYVTSTEYRAQFNKCFRFLPKLLGNGKKQHNNPTIGVVPASVAAQHTAVTGIGRLMSPQV